MEIFKVMTEYILQNGCLPGNEYWSKKFEDAIKADEKAIQVQAPVMQKNGDWIEPKLNDVYLPQDGQWCEFNIYKELNLTGQFIREDNLFVISPDKQHSAFDVITWRPLDIDWEKVGCKENEFGDGFECLLRGEDKFKNTYKAWGKYRNDELLELGEIERLAIFSA